MKVKRVEGGFIVVLERGEEVVKALTDFVNENELEGGEVRGVGGVKNVVLGFYDIERKEYLKRRFDGFFELLSLIGNISIVDGKPFCHLHATLSGRDYGAIGGHLFEATVSVTGEFFIQAAPKLTRKFDETTGLNLINP